MACTFDGVWTYLLYEDEIRSVEGPDAGRGDPEGTAPAHEVQEGDTIRYSFPNWVITRTQNPPANASAAAVWPTVLTVSDSRTSNTITSARG